MDKRYLLLGGGVLAIIGLFITVAIIFSGPKEKQETSTLNFVTYNENIDELKKVVQPFEKVNNLKVNFIKKDLANYELETLNMITTGDIDVWGIPNTWLPKHLDKLSAYNYDSAKKKLDTEYLELYKDKYPTPIAEGNIFEDKVYGFPYTFDTLALFKNNAIISAFINDNTQTLSYDQRRVLEESPRNWTDLVTHSKFLTIKSGKNITQSGVALGTQTLPQASDILTLLMEQYGAQMNNDSKTEATFQTSVNKFGGPSFPAEKALAFYTSFANPAHENYAFSEEMGDPVRAFAEGKIAYYIDYVSTADEVIFLNPKLNFSISKVPQVLETKNPVGFISYETFTVPQSSPRQQLAWDLMTYLTNSETTLNENYLENTGKYSALVTFFKRNNAIVEDSYIAQNWYNPEAKETDKILRQAITEALAGANTQTAMQAAAVKVTNLLKQLK